jgi:hypothetical protein
MTAVAFTCGIGEPYAQLAERAARRFALLNPQIPTINIAEKEVVSRNLPTPHWIKAYLWDFVGPEVDTIVWFDSDIIPIRPLPPPASPGFSACLDPLAGALGIALKIQDYVNTGFFITSRPAIRVFEALKLKWREKPPPWVGINMFFEQTAFNRLLHATGVLREKLNKKYNWSYAIDGVPDSEVLMWHFFNSRDSIEDSWGYIDAAFPVGGPSA